jgi:hypothetical protein
VAEALTPGNSTKCSSIQITAPRVLMIVCRWVYEAKVAEDRPSEHRFRDVLRNEERMRRIFEKFVCNFFVRRPGGAKSVKAELMAPAMITNVTIRYPSRTVVIECKYTECLVTNRHLEEKVKSLHLYQLSAYLRLEYRQGPGRRRGHPALPEHRNDHRKPIAAARLPPYASCRTLSGVRQSHQERAASPPSARANNARAWRATRVRRWT